MFGGAVFIRYSIMNLRSLFSIVAIVIALGMTDAVAATSQAWTQLLWQGRPPHPKTINGLDSNTRQSGDTAKVHVFLPPSDKANGKAVVLCPGGAYEFLAMDNEGFGWADFFNSRGIALIVLEYRLPGGQWEVPVEDVQEAIRLVRRNADAWHINPAAIGVGGSSAGGHLASTASTRFSRPVNNDIVSCRPDFAILFYPVITFDSALTHRGTRANLLGDNRTPESELEFSNELNVTADTPPTIIFYSSDDDIVHPFNGLRYYEALYRAGVPASLHVYPTGKHGWGSTPGFVYRQNMLEDLSAWLDSL